MLLREYDPQHFRAIHDLYGARLWKLLTEKANPVRMTTASDLRRPAAEVMGQAILDEFGDVALDHQFRKLVGHMIRHIMAELGYELDQLDVRITDGVLFTRAARYCRKVPVLAAGEAQ